MLTIRSDENSSMLTHRSDVKHKQNKILLIYAMKMPTRGDLHFWIFFLGTFGLDFQNSEFQIWATLAGAAQPTFATTGVEERAAGSTQQPG